MPSKSPKPRHLFPVRAGARTRAKAQGREGASSDGETVGAYMTRVHSAYGRMHAAVSDIVAHRPPKSVDAWRFINDWYRLYGRESAFYTANVTNPDEITDLSAAVTYAAVLIDVRKQYEARLGEKPPREDDPLAPKEEPSVFPDFPGAGSALGDVAGILKWGVIGYLAIQAIGAMRK